MDSSLKDSKRWLDKQGCGGKRRDNDRLFWRRHRGVAVYWTEPVEGNHSWEPKRLLKIKTNRLPTEGFETDELVDIDGRAAAWEFFTFYPAEGKRPYVWLRLYGPDTPFWEKTFTMPDVE